MVKVKVKKIDIHNFLSFQDENWNFDDTKRLILIKGENKDTESPLGNTSNGSGKSSFSHALMYALFGQLTGKFHNANLKNNFLDNSKNGFKMYVSVEVDTTTPSKNTTHWKIVRGIQKGQTVTLQLFRLDDEDGEWKDISKSSSANTQQFIEENVVCMNIEMYQRLVMLSVEDKYNFFKLNAAQKRDFVETMFDTSVYAKMYKMLGDDMKSKNMLMQNLKANQLRLGKTKEICEDEIEKYKAGVKNQIEETKKEKDEQERKVGEYEPQFEEIHRQQKVIEAALEKIRESKKKLEDVISQCNNNITSARMEINNCTTTISHHERELNKHKEVLGMICKDCQKIVDKFYSLDVYRKEIENLNGQIAKNNSIITKNTANIDKVRVYVEKVKSDETSKISELSDSQVQERNLKFQKSQLIGAINALERKIADLVESMENKSKIPSWNVYQQTLNEISEVEKELSEESARLILMKVGSDIVSPDSIRKNIISKVVDSINTMINANLAELCVNFSCKLSPDMNDYAIMSGDKEVDLDLRSAGERMKLLISSQLAFRKFLLSRFNVCMNVMIIDEVVDRALDSVSIQKLLGILLRLSQKESTNIYIISHRGEVEQMFNGIEDTQTMVIRKKDNVSRIVKDH